MNQLEMNQSSYTTSASMGLGRPLLRLKAGNLCASERAFSLVEVLVGLAIVAVLSALLYPTLSNAHSRARDAHAVTNVKTAWHGMQLYANDHGNRLPRGFRTPGADNPKVWQAEIGPYLYPELGDLTNNEWADMLRHDRNSPISNPAAPDYGEDSGPSLGINVNVTSHYWPGWDGYLSRVPDPSQVILIGSRDVTLGKSDYVYSIDNPRGNWATPGLYNKNGQSGIFAFVDGHIEFLDEEILTNGGEANAGRPHLWKWY